MSVEDKVYPGNLPPIQPGPKASNEWQRRWVALLNFFNIDVAALTPVEAERVLLQRLIELHQPKGMDLLLLVIPDMRAAGIERLLRKLADEFLPGLCIKDRPKKGRPNGLRTDASQRNLMLFSQVQHGRPLGQRRWQAMDKVKQVLSRYPQLAPNTQLASRTGNSEIAAYTEYRRIAGAASKHQQSRDRSFQQRWRDFMAKCNADTRAEVERCIELYDGRAQAEGDNQRAASLESEIREAVLGIIYGAEWRKLRQQLKTAMDTGDSKMVTSINSAIEKAELTPQCLDGVEFFNLFLTTHNAWMIMGHSLLQEKLATRRQ